MTDGATARLDAFTDAAFAFAVSLLVVGGGSSLDFAGLVAVMGAVPSFAIGFAIIAMFWWGHVRWRDFRGPGGPVSVVLTFALILTVLIYVHPLRAMAASFAAYLSGAPDPYPGRLGDLFAIYGIGFVAMSAIMALLFADARRVSVRRRAATGELLIWLILGATGVVSVALTRTAALVTLAPIVYATLPLTIGLFVARWRWDDQGDATA